MAAAQGLDFRKLHTGPAVPRAKAEIRKHVDFLDVDRPLHSDHNTMMVLVKTLDIKRAVEKRDRPLRDLLIVLSPFDYQKGSRVQLPVR